MVKYEKSVHYLKPELVKYFENPEDSKLIGDTRGLDVNLICPGCGMPKIIKARTLWHTGFKCSRCKSNDSYPNRFMGLVLRDVGIDFIKEAKFSWSLNKRYDFYIPSLNAIIEMHGLQHYEKTRFTGAKSLECTQENDVLKEKLAIENGIEYYFAIDCRNPKFHILKQHTLDSELSNKLDIGNFDWDAIENELIDDSMVGKICGLWNACEHKEIYRFAKEVGHSHNYVYKFIQIGIERGICEPWDGRNNSENNLIEYNPHKPKMVHQFDKDMNFIREYASVKEVESITGISNKNVSAVCNGRRKYAGGYIWKHNKD